MDKTWLYHYDPETKQQSMEWWHSGLPRPKKFQAQKYAGKFLASIFWDFLSGLQKLEQWAKKCIELCWEYVE